MDHQIRHLQIDGFGVTVDDTMGKLMVAHDGNLTWDQLQTVKNTVWGSDARAIEVFPAQCDVVNAGNFRHLWRLGAGDFCPDLLGYHQPSQDAWDGLQYRCFAPWRAAELGAA